MLHALDLADLTAPRLKAKIEQALAAPYPTHEIATNGAFVTSEKIRAVLSGAGR